MYCQTSMKSLIDSPVLVYQNAKNQFFKDKTLYASTPLIIPENHSFEALIVVINSPWFAKILMQTKVVPSDS